MTVGQAVIKPCGRYSTRQKTEAKLCLKIAKPVPRTGKYACGGIYFKWNQGGAFGSKANKGNSKQCAVLLIVGHFSLRDLFV